jgi:sigma-E factor negative regulatory protein RseA
MSEKIQEQISAFLDGELPANEAELLVHRLSRDEGMHAKALSFSVIGAAMRNELLQPDPHVLRRRVSNALDGEPSSKKLAAPPAWTPLRLARPLVGLAVAGGVAVVAILGLQNITRQSPVSTTGARVANGVEQGAPVTYVVPREPVGASMVRVPVRLTNYLVNHGEYASGLRRAAIHSDIVGYRSDADREDDATDREAP